MDTSRLEAQFDGLYRMDQSSTPLIGNLPFLRLLDNRCIAPMTTDRTDRIGRYLRPCLSSNIIRAQFQLIASFSPPTTHSTRPTGQGSECNGVVCPRTLATASVSIGVAVLADHAAFEHGKELFEAGQGGGHDCDVGTNGCDDCDGDAGVY